MSLTLRRFLAEHWKLEVQIQTVAVFFDRYYSTFMRADYSERGRDTNLGQTDLVPWLTATDVMDQMATLAAHEDYR